MCERNELACAFHSHEVACLIFFWNSNLIAVNVCLINNDDDVLYV